MSNEHEIQGEAPPPTEPREAPGEVRKLRRPRQGRLLAGVSAGLARYFDMHPAVYRIAFAALALVGGAGLVIYAVAWLVIPEEGSDESIASEALRDQRDRPWLVVGVGLVALGLILAASPGPPFWLHPGAFWLVVLATGAGIVLWQLSRRDRPVAAGAGGGEVVGGAPAPAPRDPRPSLFLPGVGVLLTAAGILAALDKLDVASVDWDLALAGGVILVGILVAVGSRWRRTTGLAVLGVFLALALGAALAADVPHGRDMGERTYVPLTAAELADEYHLHAGRLELDLSDLALPLGETAVAAEVGMGELVVYVPEDVAVSASADIGAGDANVLGHRQDGFGVDERVVDPDFEDAPRRLVVEADVGMGEIRIVRAGE